MTRTPTLLASLAVLLGISVFAFTTKAEKPADSDSDSKSLKALLITGGCCHDYDNQKLIIPTGIDERTNLKIDWTVVHQGGKALDAKIPVYEDENWADGYDVVVHNECFAKIDDKAWADRIINPHKAGTPAVLIHCAMHCYRVGDDRWFEFCGVTSRGHGPKHAFDVVNLKPDHPVMKDFGDKWTTPQGELYFIERLFPTATPLAESKSEAKGDMHTNVWTNDFGPNKTRVFGTTIGHHNETMVSPEYLNLLTRGVLWAAGKLSDDNLNTVAPADSLKTLPAENKIDAPKPPRKKKAAKKPKKK